MDYRYKWQNSYSEKNKISIDNKRFIEKIFDILNNGTKYVDVMGNFMGYVSLVHGSLGSVQIISDHSLTTDNGSFIIIKAIYLDRNALYLVISKDSLSIREFNNGLWANSVMRVKYKNG